MDITALLDDPATTSPHNDVGFYFYKNNKVEAARYGKWKLHIRDPKKMELYDLRADIGESNNLAESNPEKVQQLLAKIEAYDTDLKANTRPAWFAADYQAPKPKQKKPKGKKSNS